MDFLKKVGRLYPSAQGGKAYKILSIRPQGQMALLQLEGVEDMDAARALRGQVFYFDRGDATLPAGRWYVADLIGCEVRDADTGKPYGKLCDITETGANRVYHIRFADGKVRLAPDIPQVVLRLAPEEGVIEIRPLAGLFDDVTEDDYEV